mmetsp:Transcript_49444/g.148992  ORF Transcript_49444/g.148992 Transcript_49444/m.148992 type:complete len:269 (+) Transcript_49444:992-1798(+)
MHGMKAAMRDDVSNFVRGDGRDEGTEPFEFGSTAIHRFAVRIDGRTGETDAIDGVVGVDVGGVGTGRVCTAADALAGGTAPRQQVRRVVGGNVRYRARRRHGLAVNRQVMLMMLSSHPPALVVVDVHTEAVPQQRQPGLQGRLTHREVGAVHLGEKDAAQFGGTRSGSLSSSSSPSSSPPPAALAARLRLLLLLLLPPRDESPLVVLLHQFSQRLGIRQCRGMYPSDPAQQFLRFLSGDVPDVHTKGPIGYRASCVLPVAYSVEHSTP